MKYNGRFLLVLALALLAGAICSSAVYADTVSVTIQKWTSGFGSMSGSTTMPVYVDGSNGTGSVSTFPGFGFIYTTGPASSTTASDPFAGAIDIQLNLSLISDSATESLLTSDAGITKTDSSSYWVKIFVDDSTLSLPGSSGSVLSSTTQYTQTTNTGSTSGTLKSTISDSGSTVNFASATLPFVSLSDTKGFTRASSTYDIKHEFDIALTGTKSAQVDGGISTHTVPEPVTILSALIGLVPMGLMVKSFRRRKAIA